MDGIGQTPRELASLLEGTTPYTWLKRITSPTVLFGYLPPCLPIPFPCPPPRLRPIPPPLPDLREGLSEFGLMAFTGQALKHLPHLVQSALLIYALPAFITIAPSTGQALIHNPHPVQISSLIQRNINTSFIVIYVYCIYIISPRNPLSQISSRLRQ